MNKIERMTLNTELLRTFVAIADLGNLTIAAGQLNRTQSAISVQLRKLEQDLGARLFARSARGMRLTEAGERLLPRARSILADLREVGALFDAPLTGEIRIGVPDDFDDFVLGHLLARFADAHPGVDVIATSGCTSGFPSAIRDGDLDIAVYSGAGNEEGETLGHERTIWAAASVPEVQDPAPVPLAILDRACWWRDLPIKALTAVGRDYTVAFRSTSFASVRAAIGAGFAIGVVPGTCLDTGMVELTEADGFPALPQSRRSIIIRPGADRALTEAMSEAIRGARTAMLQKSARPPPFLEPSRRPSPSGR